VTRFAALVNGIDDLAVTNVDGLDTLDRIQVCTAYQLNGKTVNYPPSDLDELAGCVPVYQEFEGWKSDTSGAKSWSDLPPKCQVYLEAIAKFTGAKLGIVSVGPGREQTILL
jgi:adenylosuccinate synthase